METALMKIPLRILILLAAAALIAVAGFLLLTP